MPEQPVYPGTPIPQTSVASPFRHPNEVTVRFNRWTQVGMTAYQKGQCAGFLRPLAEQLQAKGAARILDMAEPATVTAGEAVHAAPAGRRSAAA